jgi:hypothetical protein
MRLAYGGNIIFMLCDAFNDDRKHRVHPIQSSLEDRMSNTSYGDKALERSKKDANFYQMPRDFHAVGHLM